MKSNLENCKYSMLNLCCTTTFHKNTKIVSLYFCELCCPIKCKLQELLSVTQVSWENDIWTYPLYYLYDLVQLSIL